MFDARQAELLRKAATRLPAGSWSLEPVQATRRWMVYLGPFADEEAVAKKRSELRAAGVAYDRPGAALEPGLSLGRYSSAEGALRALSQLGAQGVRKARVVQERGDTAGFTLRLPAVDEALRTQPGDAAAGTGRQAPAILRLIARGVIPFPNHSCLEAVGLGASAQSAAAA